MWHMLEKITEQVTKYSTFLGQLWYILVFIFRLIVVVTIGGSVYGDEQSSFKCSTDVVGCENICYNEFAKISHMRFWAFQLLAVATPAVMFHFYTLYVNGEIQKLRIQESKLREMEEGTDGASLLAGDDKAEKDFRKMSRRKKSIGNIKTRQIYSGNTLQDVTYTNKIHYAYYVSIIVRAVNEVVFIYLGYILFKKMVPDHDCQYHPSDPLCVDSGNPLYFLWMKVPAMYRCRGDEGSEVYSACTMHVRDEGFVPCFVSRPYEKTVFLCYMSMLAGLCFVISLLELVIVSIRRFWKKRKPRHKHLVRQPFDGKPRNESVFYGPNPTAPSKGSHNFYDERWGHNYPSLGVPVRIAHRYEDPSAHQAGKTVTINDEDRNSVRENARENYSDQD